MVGRIPGISEISATTISPHAKLRPGGGTTKYVLSATLISAMRQRRPEEFCRYDTPQTKPRAFISPPTHKPLCNHILGLIFVVLSFVLVLRTFLKRLLCLS